MWQSFMAIGRGSSENEWRNKKQDTSRLKHKPVRNYRSGRPNNLNGADMLTMLYFLRVPSFHGTMLAILLFHYRRTVRYLHVLFRELFALYRPTRDRRLSGSRYLVVIIASDSTQLNWPVGLSRVLSTNPMIVWNATSVCPWPRRVPHWLIVSVVLSLPWPAPRSLWSGSAAPLPRWVSLTADTSRVTIHLKPQQS